ncbi:MAG: hypothetical protein U1D41_06700 [Nitrosomonas sp.]|jgi:hypothetical protein|uniref:hypothetical protein n=1 Tax=Nitrosomonas sp. TaxID=42353 RepID=UPI00272F86FF|nr:hypothetical protein [Nitrosomonas sp.]MBK6957721.1 hypothetical protein [Nitrosomonas sp.]MDP1549807.1 hypothetical protein [Nitrosomonas sp.]MDP1933301.1 hypothetical protein [Nitrosomonas sp.]MDP3280641.1 hypothetical protein [Nitrosomonas sp.]MDP3662282.1 hypothetical protein [Nitrosomonas sp.]
MKTLKLFTVVAMIIVGISGCLSFGSGTPGPQGPQGSQGPAGANEKIIVVPERTDEKVIVVPAKSY